MKNFLDQFVHGKKTYFVAAMALAYLAGGYMGWWVVDDKVLEAFGFGAAVTLRHALAKLGNGQDGQDLQDGNSAAGSGPRGATGPTTGLPTIASLLIFAGFAGFCGICFSGCASGGLMDRMASSVSRPQVTVVTNTVVTTVTNLVPVGIAVPGATVVTTNFVERVVTNLVEHVSTVTNFVEREGIATGLQAAKTGAAVATAVAPPYGAMAGGAVGIIGAAIGGLVAWKNKRAAEAANASADELAAQNASVNAQLASVVKGVEDFTGAIDKTSGDKLKETIAKVSTAMGVDAELHDTVKAITS
jgi:hypothetical protein